MYGKEVHKGRRINRSNASQEGKRRNESGNRCKLWTEQETSSTAHQSSKSEGTENCSRIYSKGRPRKESASEEVKRSNEIAQLRMQVELLRNFLCEAGRR